MTLALTIAGSDPTGGAGLQLDLQVFALHGVHGMAVPTALTVQTTKGVRRTNPVFPSVVAEQITALLDDLRPRVLKLGMLATDDIVLSVSNALDRYDIPRVVDPVFRASDGTLLLEQRALGNLLERLVHGAALVTPNLPEAEALTGETDPERAAHAFLELGAEAALVKGGHAEGPADDFLRLAPEAACGCAARGAASGPSTARAARSRRRSRRGSRAASRSRTRRAGRRSGSRARSRGSHAPGKGARLLRLEPAPE